MPSFYLKKEQKDHLKLIREVRTEDVIELCKCAFEYLVSGPKHNKYEQIAKKYKTPPDVVQRCIEALILMLIDATKQNATEADFEILKKDGFTPDIISIFTQFVDSKRLFIEGSIKTANIKAYRLINLEWRLEVTIASRCLLKQYNVFVTMKLTLHTEPKNENRDLIVFDKNEPIHPEEAANRRDVLVQTDLSNLVHMINILEQALLESKSHRNRNILESIQKLCIKD